MSTKRPLERELASVRSELARARGEEEKAQDRVKAAQGDRSGDAWRQAKRTSEAKQDPEAKQRAVKSIEASVAAIQDQIALAGGL